MMTAYLASYFCGIVFVVAPLLYLGSIFQGLSNGGGQLTWSLASSHFAPSAEEVPLYNGIHFVLNGVRGLVLPWVGSILFILTGPWAVLAATLVSASSVPVVIRSLRQETGTRSPETEIEEQAAKIKIYESGEGRSDQGKAS